jgi:flagellar assembly factor FliW
MRTGTEERMAKDMTTLPAEDQRDEDLPIIDFLSPMPGFAGHQRFVLVQLDTEGMLYALTSLHDNKVRFLVMPPGPFFPDYSPEVPQDSVELLGITEAEQVLLLLVVTAGEKAGDATVNLLAPILVDHSNRHALQVVLSGSDLPVRAELMAVA